MSRAEEVCSSSALDLCKDYTNLKEDNMNTLNFILNVDIPGVGMCKCDVVILPYEGEITGNFDFGPILWDWEIFNGDDKIDVPMTSDLEAQLINACMNEFTGVNVLPDYDESIPF
jgi:hypothetical protein